jgi:uracil-DNA glycosylase
MSLELDERQRGMLREMGVELFWPESGQVAQESVIEAAEMAVAAPAEVVSAPTPVRVPVQVRAPSAPTPTLLRGGREEGGRHRIAGTDAMDWEALAGAVAECRACGLCEGRTNTVFGVGDLQADWMVIGEAPGENEDLQGEPFVGQAGKLLDNMLAALGVGRRKGAYIANVLKCRPPGNRNPLPEEIAQCEPFLRRQVELLQPKIILAMGRFAVHTLLQTTEPVGKLRGRVHRYHGVPLVVTYHPAYLLRNLPDKAKAWSDLCLAQSVMRELTQA